jgi:hypothetical protein
VAPLQAAPYACRNLRENRPMPAMVRAAEPPLTIICVISAFAICAGRDTSLY